MQIGSKEHKELFCRVFVETHRPFEPEALPWPDLDDDLLELLRGIPFWEEAVENETAAGPKVAACAGCEPDPLVREALSLQADEETRHGRILALMIERYGIEVSAPQPSPPPKDLEDSFIDFGFTECLDAFGAFGIFELARQTELFPPDLLEIFDQILVEEARHIVFFTNWIHWTWARRGISAPARTAMALRWYGRVVGDLVGRAQGDDDEFSQDSFTLRGADAFIENLTPRRFVRTCLEQNARRMADVDERLLQPRLIPRLASAGHTLLRLLPKRWSDQKLL